MSIMERIIEWLFPPRRLRVSNNVPWPEKDIRRAVGLCMKPFFWPAIDNHGIHVVMRNRPANSDRAGGASDGCIIFLDYDLIGVPLSRTGLAHECEHVRQVMLGNPRWADHTDELFERVRECNKVLKAVGL